MTTHNDSTSGTDPNKDKWNKSGDDTKMPTDDDTKMPTDDDTKKMGNDPTPKTGDKNL